MRTVPMQLPRLRELAGHALPNIVEATIVPLGLFYLAMWWRGVWFALGAALAWSLAMVGRRVVRARRMPGVLVLGSLALVVRTVIAVASGSVFVYFVQPVLGTLAVAFAFLVSAVLRRPLTARLAADFCPLPEGFCEQHPVRRFFVGISALWGIVYVLNALVTLWLLVSVPLSTYLWVKTVVSFGLTGTAIVVSTLWFLRTARRHGLLIRRDAVAPEPATLSVGHLGIDPSIGPALAVSPVPAQKSVL